MPNRLWSPECSAKPLLSHSRCDRERREMIHEIGRLRQQIKELTGKTEPDISTIAITDDEREDSSDDDG